MKRALLVVGCALTAAVAFADTVRRGDRIPSAPASGPVAPTFTLSLPGAAAALAAHPDGRAALVVRQELVLVDPDGKLKNRRSLPAAGRSVVFGEGESLAADLATGSAVLRYRDLYTRSWDEPAGKASVIPVALPPGGFAFGRGDHVVLTDGEAHELRRVQLPTDYELDQLHVLPDGLWAFATKKDAETALVHLAWGEKVTVRAVVRGKANDRRLGVGGADLAMEDGSLVHVATQTGAITRTNLPDEAYAITAWQGDRSVAILKGELVLFRRPGLRAGKPFGPGVNRTDAGVVVPRVLVAGGEGGEPFWVLAPDGTLYANDAASPDARALQAMRCESSGAFLVATKGRALVACQNRLVGVSASPAPGVQAGDAGSGFRW